MFSRNDRLYRIQGVILILAGIAVQVFAMVTGRDLGNAVAVTGLQASLSGLLCFIGAVFGLFFPRIMQMREARRNEGKGAANVELADKLDKVE